MAGPDGDRRWTAVLSLDMVGFTEVSNRIGPERVFALIEHVLGHARSCVEEHGGYVVDTAGDGMLVAFGAPVAVEKASLEACRAALAFREALRSSASDLEASFGVLPQFRAGLAGGNVMVARTSAEHVRLIGAPVNEAARLQALAVPGEILVSGTIRNETEGYVTTEERGEVEIRGFAEPIEVHALVGLTRGVATFEGSRRRGLLDMISRERDLDAALGALRTGRTNRTVVISGAPGIGKSRLAHEITLALAPDRPVHVGQCASNATDYAPIIDVLRQAAGAPFGFDRAECLAALFARHPDLENSAAARAFLEPLGGQRDPSERAMRDRDFLGELLVSLQRKTGAVYLLEDAHWVDTATDGLVAALSRTDLALVITARPEHAASWALRPGITNIDLGPLSDEAICRLAEASFGRPLSNELGDLIAEKSEGNPLMAEEIARTLRQSDRLTETAGEVGIAPGQMGPFLSGNLEQLVLSRVDRLAPEQKATLQAASVIGRDFSGDLLARALGRPAGLEEVAATPGLIEAGQAGRWRFAHALIRDAVYASLLSAQRQAAHRAVAEAMEAIEGPGPESFGVLAEHFDSAGMPGKAVRYLVRSAEQHLSAYALRDVDRDLARVHAAVVEDPSLLDDEEYRLFVLVWLRALDQIGDFGRLKSVAAQILPRLEAMGYSPSLGIARTLTSIAMAHARDYAGAEALAERTRREAEAEGDAWAAAWSKVALMRIHDETGWKDRGLIEEMATEIGPVAEETGDSHLAMNALYLLSSSYRSSGYRLKSLEVAKRLEALSVSHNDRRAKAFSLWARALVYSIDGNPEMAHTLGREARGAAIPGSADERVGRGIELFALSFLRPAEEMRPRIEALVAEAAALEDFNISDAMEWTLCLLDLRHGDLARGWRRLVDLIPSLEARGNLNILRQAFISKGEILVGIAGLVDPASEAPPERPTFERKRPGLADIATFFRLRLTARRSAEHVYRRCLDLDPLKHGPNFARCEIGLGLIAASRGDTERARAHLSRGLVEAEGEGHALLASRARRAISRLR